MTAHTTTDYKYAPVPEDLLFADDVTHLEVRIYAVLARHGVDPSSCYPSHARIAKFAHCSKRSVAGALRNLEQLGWIDRVHRVSEAGDPLSNGYHVRSSPQRTPGTPEQGPPGTPEQGPPRSKAPVKKATERKQSERERGHAPEGTVDHLDLDDERDTPGEVPADWALTERQRRVITTNYPTVDVEDLVASFVSHARARGSKFKRPFDEVERWARTRHARAANPAGDSATPTERCPDWDCSADLTPDEIGTVCPFGSSAEVCPNLRGQVPVPVEVAL